MTPNDKKPESVCIYKTKPLKYIITNNIISRTNIIQEKIDSHTLTIANMNEVNEIDEIITKGMLLAEKSICFHRNNHPWSPTLVKAILDVQLWKTTISIVLNKQSRKKSIDNIINRMTHYNHSPKNIHCTNIKLLSKYLRESKKHLKGIKHEATNHREVHLTQLADEEFIFGNIKHAR